MDPTGHLPFWIAAMIIGVCIGAGYAVHKDWKDGGIDGSLGVGGYIGCILGGAAIGVVAGLAAGSLLAGSFTACCGQVLAGAEGLAWAYTMGGSGAAILYMANNFFRSVGVDVSWMGYWPSNNGFSGPTESITLEPGTVLQRIGGPGGTFVSPYFTDPMSLSLPYNQMVNMYSPNLYIVNSSITVTAGQAAPWFGQYGGGIQYVLPMTIQKLLDAEIISHF